ncbi:ABC bile acid transporter [Pseudohyphozyma bogoriensis]|nr:ABC bile acid transporter [Pseudohyphozyma bogoriensis]
MDQFTSSEQLLLLGIGAASTPSPHDPSEPWCTVSDLFPVWDGVDFSPCFRIRILSGVVPLVFLAISASLLLLLALTKLYALIFPSTTTTSIPLSRSSNRRLSIASARSRTRSVSRSNGRPRGAERAALLGALSDDDVQSEIATSGPKAITEAENEVIIGVVDEQSPDLRLKDVLELGTGRKVSQQDVFEDEDEEEKVPLTAGMMLKAVGGVKKDVVNVVGAVLVMSGAVARLVADRDTVIGNWGAIVVAAWAYTTLLTLLKLVVGYHTKLRHYTRPSRPHRVSPYYTTLEAHIIPWFLVYTIISFFDIRSTLIHVGPHGQVFTRSLAIFVLATLLFSIELFAPRPSRFSSRSPNAPPPSETALPPTPEYNASLFSLLTFSFISPFMITSAFPKAGSPPVTLADVPDLRPDDKTARVLLAFRRDTASVPLFRKPTLSVKLLWFFRQELLLQQFCSLIRVAVVAVPAMFLQAFLSVVGRRARREANAEVHVAVLYAFGMFFFQNIGSLAASQSLYLGRRMCIRLRSIVVGEIFTKALRRKDMAGSDSRSDKDKAADAESTEPTGEGEDSAESPKEEKKEGDEAEDNEKATHGKVLNLISVDTYRVSEIASYLHFLTELSLTIVVTLVLLFRVLGLSAIAGLATILVCVPLQTYIAKVFYKYQVKVLAAADARLNLATEVITSVRIVKWEKKFIEKMDVARANELAALWSRAIAMVYGGIMMSALPALVSVATFTFHTKVLRRDLTSETAFTALALFTLIRSPLEGFSDMLVSVLSAHVSLKRVNTYLEEEETAKYTTIQAPSAASDPTIGFINGSFTWSDVQLAEEDPSVFRLEGLDLAFPVGKLSLILGPVGSGKTTLLLSLLGETNKLSGHAFLPSPVMRSTGEDPSVLTNTTAYCSQSPWLLSDTIRENILFGSPYNAKRYEMVLDACALRPDLKQFELGDETEVGERGTTCSGGQKARIALARAMYSSAKYILLDDVLSAVDSHTGQHLFTECLTGKIMRHRTCVLVTHAAELCLPGSAFVVQLDNGHVVSSGASDTHELHSASLALPKHVVEEEAHESAITIEAIAEGTTDELIATQEEARLKKEKFKLIQDENQAEGAVGWDVYIVYLKALGGWTLAGACVAIFALAQLFEISVSLALRYWAGAFDNASHSVVQFFTSTARSAVQRSHAQFYYPAQSVLLSSAADHDQISAYTGENASTDYWLRIYILLVALNMVFFAGRMAFFQYRGLSASRILYQRLINKILGAPIRFFDSTPTGRILNRLSKDVEILDQDLSSTMTYFLLEVIGTIAIIATISVVLPMFLIGAAFVAALFVLVGYTYLASSRELKRSESVTKSPIFGLFGETLNGVSTVRAYGDSSRFIKNIFALVDTNNRAFVTLITAIAVLIKPGTDAATAGFVLTFAMSFMERMLWVVRLYAQLEINFNSVERIKEYLDLDQEKEGGVVPPAIWPSREGSIEVDGLTASYAPDLPPVLKNVSFKEKVGIVGRTGSGKSTLGLSFFRFIEPTSGRIVIDGLDINTLSLTELRSRITIVAQESALFAGSLRFNLDPFNLYEDSDIWDALQRVQMAPPASSTRGPSRVPSSTNVAGASGSDSESTVAEDDKFVVKSLDMAVTDGGKNFSAGQRQLLALARGILKLSSSSILILDESTASLDQATDERIQLTIREEMADATILCIAHRLRTVINFDKILVLGAGEVIEYDSPWALIDKEGSAFNELCKNSGEYEALVELAHAKRDSSK